jgi:signal transduction histidine kinase/DNA-binding NarL/FixJ family response regulator/CHASE3 domain sensor protein
MYNIVRPHSGIRTKVVLGFMVTLLAVVAVGFVMYNSSNKLLNSLTTLSKPDNELRQSSNILALLGEAESNIRIFTLTRDHYYFKAYSDNIEAITHHLTDLRTALIASGNSTEKIDNILLMMRDRHKATSIYIDYLDSTKENHDANSAIRKLIAGHKDSVEAKVLSKSTTVTHMDTVAAASKIKPGGRGSTSFFERFTNLFKKKEKRKQRHNTAEPLKIFSNTQVTSDTNIIFKPDTASFADINRLLSVMDIQDTQQKAMTGKEIQLLRSNALIIEQMMNVVKQIEIEQIRQRDRNMSEARYTARESIQVIFIVVTVSLVAIFMIAILIFRSVARSNSYRNQLIEAKIKAEQLAKVTDDFLANMSHEIRTPLSAILGFSEQLAKTELEDVQKNYLEVVRKSSSHLLMIVNDILDYSRLGAGKLTFEIIPFREQQVMSDVFETLAGSAGDKGLTLEVMAPDNTDEPILGDPFRLKQVLLNLVGNAIKFTSTGFVRIESERHLQTDGILMLQVSVSDTGIGIAEDKLSMIFNDFTQADTSSTRQYGGSGLGLAICKRLVEMQNGTIAVESTPGLGSKFTLNIPCMPFSAASPDESGQQASADNTSLKGKKILLVDDDAFNILLTRIIIENWGMSVEVAMNGREGVEKAGESDFDLVLTDINMPEISGIELTRIIRALPDEHRASVPVIAFTANAVKEDLEKYMLSGIDGFLLKPFKENDVYAKIQEVLSLAIAPCSNGIQVDLSEKRDPTALYDLSRIRQFAGNKPETLARILQSFIQQSQEDMAILENHSKNSDWQAAAEMAHKMLTSYGHFGVNNAMESLQMLDKQRSGNIDPKASAQAVKQLRSVLNDLIPVLENETGA